MVCLQRLAQLGLFGRSLPPTEQCFIIITDSVVKQLDGLKNEPASGPAIRRFLGRGLDALGPPGGLPAPACRGPYEGMLLLANSQDRR